jgi:threonine synthase
MHEGAALLGRRGISAAIEGGATLAAAVRLAEAGELQEGDTVVLFNTANMLTY